MTEHSQETKIAILEAKVEHMMGHVKELTQRVRANEKVVASVSLLGVIACTIIGAGYFAPKAEACSPPLDGSEFICPSHDGVVDRPTPVAVLDEPNIDYSNGQREEFRWNAGSVIQRMRDWKSEQERTPVEDSINNALANLEWNYGSDDTAEQEELLQLPSDGD
jgi:hypothetical protein